MKPRLLIPATLVALSLLASGKTISGQGEPIGDIEPSRSALPDCPRINSSGSRSLSPVFEQKVKDRSRDVDRLFNELGAKWSKLTQDAPSLKGGVFRLQTLYRDPPDYYSTTARVHRYARIVPGAGTGAPRCIHFYFYSNSRSGAKSNYTRRLVTLSLDAGPLARALFRDTMNGVNSRYELNRLSAAKRIRALRYFIRNLRDMKYALDLKRFRVDRDKNRRKKREQEERERETEKRRTSRYPRPI